MSNQHSDPPELNGIELTDLDAAREALDYLHDDYHDGDLIGAEGGRCLIVISRSASFENYEYLENAQVLKLHPKAIDRGDGEEPDVRLKVEIRERDAE